MCRHHPATAGILKHPEITVCHFKLGNLERSIYKAYRLLLLLSFNILHLSTVPSVDWKPFILISRCEYGGRVVWVFLSRAVF